MRTISIFNTLTGTKEPFVPLAAGKVNMYVCGPTVYDYIHIGNARPMIFFDVVRRFFRYAGFDVNYVVNFTDVDDKLIRRSEETGVPVPELAEKFIGHYLEDAEALGVGKADVHPRVTENMDAIIRFIRELEDKGFAYESGGDVYFRTGKFSEYGKLSGQDTEQLQYGIRVQVDERKEDPRDFVLWKQAKPGEICWDSPWGKGRPGWHIECSAMARRYLGDTLDIHGGGHDLAFPHHECEIAQSESLTGKPLARYWMHNGYINIREEKMSKSLGNVVNVRDLLKNWRPEVIRFFMLSTHYRNPLNFSEEGLAQAKGAVERIENCLVSLRHRLSAAEAANSDQPSADDDAEAAYLAKLPELEEAFASRMADDFNTPDAIAAVFEWVSETNLLLKRERVSRAALETALAWAERVNGVLGIAGQEDGGMLDEEVERLIAERQEARKQKNWAKADEIRDRLAEQGIVLEDTPQGVRWRRK
jgi:cysteinyl-tRNA synthetase